MKNKTVSLNPEFRLLLHLSRAYQDDLDFPFADVEQLLAECDFELFRLRLNQARTWPMVYRNVKQFSVRLPENIFLLLKERSHAVVRQNLQHQVLQNKIQQAFERKKIPCIFLKGVSLGERLMGTIGLRHSCDIDVFVPSGVLMEALDVLKMLGCECIDEQYYGDFEFELLKKVNHHTCYQHKATGFVIELHWRLYVLDEVFVLPDSFWQDYEVATEPAKNLLPDEVLLIYLCFHGGTHLWARLKWLLDIELLVANAEWDWGLLLEKAGQFKVERFLVLSALLLNQLCSIPVPKEIELYLKQKPMLYFQAQKTIELSFNNEIGGNSAFYGFKRSLDIIAFKARLYPDYITSLSILCQMTRPRLTDLHTVELPKKLFFLYYIIRPIRIAIEILLYGDFKR